MKKIKIIINKTVGVTLLVLAFATLFLSVSFHYAGFHNTDFVYNYQNLALQVNPHLYPLNLSFMDVSETEDYGSHGIKTLGEYYRLGTFQSERGFILMFISGMLFTVGVTTLLIAPKPN